jgi:hypothetical protein
MVDRAATEGPDISGGMANGAVVAGESFTEVLAGGAIVEGVVVDGGINDGLLIAEALLAGALVGRAWIAEVCGVQDREGLDYGGLGCRALDARVLGC